MNSQENSKIVIPQDTVESVDLPKETLSRKEEPKTQNTSSENSLGNTEGLSRENKYTTASEREIILRIESLCSKYKSKMERQDKEDFEDIVELLKGTLQEL